MRQIKSRQPKDRTKVLRAGLFALAAHRGEKKAMTGGPYIKHPIGAAKILKEFMLRHKEELLKTSRGQKLLKILPILIRAELLHDTMENTNTTYSLLKSRFGKRTADLVREVTTNREEAKRIGGGNYQSGKGEYLLGKMKTMSSEALLMKLADRLQNISDCHANIPEHPDYMKKYIIQTKQIVDGINPRINEETIVHQELHASIKRHLAQLTSEVEQFFAKQKPIVAPNLLKGGRSAK